MNLRPHRPERRRLGKTSTNSTKLIWLDLTLFRSCSEFRCNKIAKRCGVLVPVSVGIGGRFLKIWIVVEVGPLVLLDGQPK